tara:strand:- start:658 stop:831 length:174 start_codon:yes stop_codon:yes gene_type:complete
MKTLKKDTDKKKSFKVTNVSINTKTKKISGNLFSKKSNNIVVKSGQTISGKISKPKK